MYFIYLIILQFAKVYFLKLNSKIKISRNFLKQANFTYKRNIVYIYTFTIKYAQHCVTV